MTIAAGFKCSDGLVLCADSQITTYDGYWKSNEVKIIPYKSSECEALFTYAGDVDMAKCAIQQITERLSKNIGTPEELRNQLRGLCIKINDTYQRFYPNEMIPTLPCAVRMEKRLFLFKLLGASVHEIDQGKFQCIGMGDSLARFLISQSSVSNMDMRRTSLVAAETLFFVKQHVTGCGGNSIIVKFGSSGNPVLVDINYVSSLQEYFSRQGKYLGKLPIELLLSPKPEEILGNYSKFLTNPLRALHSQMAPLDPKTQELIYRPEEVEIAWPEE